MFIQIATVVCVAAHLVLAPLRAQTGADHGIKGLREWADSVSDSVNVKWMGPRVPWLRLDDLCGNVRPKSIQSLHASTAPVTIHDAVGVAPERLKKTLSYVESARSELRAKGWTLSNLGHLDIYLVQEGSRFCTEGITRALLLDTVVGYLMISKQDAFHLDRVQKVYLDALLQSLDPAESITWRDATIQAIQVEQSPHPDDSLWHATTSWVSDVHASGWILQRLESKYSGWITSLWQVLRQRTWEGHGFRASPDAWEVLRVLLNAQGVKIEPWLMECAEERVMWRLVHNLPLADAHSKNLPVHFDVFRPFVSAYGSVFARLWIDAPETATYKVWLEGETGVNWRWSVLRMDAQDQVLTSIAAPPRQTFRQLVPVEITPETRSLVMVATNVPPETLDADTPNEWERAARFIVSR